MNTATQIRRQLQAIALREVTHSIDSKEAVEISELLWRRARRLGVDKQVHDQLELVARGRLV